MSPGVNDGAVLRQTLDELYGFGPAILGVLGGAGRAHRVQQASSRARANRRGVPGGDRADRRAGARPRGAERGMHWAFGADELYLRAGVELPPAEIYDGFEQVENGVGSVRWLQQRIGDASAASCEGGRAADRRGRPARRWRQLMPMVLEPLAAATGAQLRADSGGELRCSAPRSRRRGCCPGAAMQRRRSAAGATSIWRCFPASR